MLLSVQALLASPNPNDPLANDVAEDWIKDEEGAIKTAREWTEAYASKKDQKSTNWIRRKAEITIPTNNN
mgnify:CR=1 FL=1